MSTACLLEWVGVSSDQIDALMDLLDLEKNLKEGSAVYGAAEDGGMLIVVTVWETQAALDQFLESCLAKAVLRTRLQFPFIKRWDLDANPENSVMPLTLTWEDSLKLQIHGPDRKN